MDTADVNMSLDGLSPSGSVDEEEEDTILNDINTPAALPPFDAHRYIEQELKWLADELQAHNISILMDLQAVNIMDALDFSYQTICTYQQQRLDIVIA